MIPLESLKGDQSSQYGGFTLSHCLAIGAFIGLHGNVFKITRIWAGSHLTVPSCRTTFKMANFTLQGPQVLFVYFDRNRAVA
jgi:hypothetical protein